MSGDDWELLDELLVVLRRRSYPADEILEALTTCMAKIIVMTTDDESGDARMIEAISRALPTVVDFQRKVIGEGG